MNACTYLCIVVETDWGGGGVGRVQSSPSTVQVNKSHSNTFNTNISLSLEYNWSAVGGLALKTASNLEDGSSHLLLPAFC